MFDLSPEDSLRLHVMVANAEAIRIDENQMLVYGLSGEQEMKLQLNPTCRSDKYLTLVREMLSGAVLDSPGGYPVFLRRWTRMGQIDNEQMGRLLKLGEPEAVMAVVCSPGLDNALARLAWWSAPYAEHARRMLENPRVVTAPMGKVLADYLIEYLPFESEHRDMLNTVRLVLQPGLLDEEGRRRLWQTGAKRPTYWVGFLRTSPDALLDPSPARAEFNTYRERLAALVVGGNAVAARLLQMLDAPGQRFARVAAICLARPADQDVAAALLDAIGAYCRFGNPDYRVLRTWADVQAYTSTLDQGPEVQVLRQLAPELSEELDALLLLACVSEYLVTPIFAVTDAVGTVMQERIEPITQPILERLSTLAGERFAQGRRRGGRRH